MVDFSKSLAETDAEAVKRLSALATMSSWRERELPPPDYIMGEWLHTASRVITYARTGLGKSNLFLALGLHAAAGVDFLQWQARRPARVLYVEGEMPRCLLNARLGAALGRLRQKPDTFFVLSREDAPGLRDLNTITGQRYVDRVIHGLGGVDLVIVDDIDALLGKKASKTWEATIQWARALSSRNIGQIWIHHTGRGLPLWLFDTEIQMVGVKDPNADISFQMRFPRASERGPHNRSDFEPVRVTLKDDQWQSQRYPKKNGPRAAGR